MWWDVVIALMAGLGPSEASPIPDLSPAADSPLPAAGRLPKGKP
jgi:hypothetical protein